MSLLVCNQLFTVAFCTCCRACQSAVAPVGQCRIFVKNQNSCQFVSFRTRIMLKSQSSFHFTAIYMIYEQYFERHFVLSELVQGTVASPVSSGFHFNRMISVLDTQTFHHEEDWTSYLPLIDNCYGWPEGPAHLHISRQDLFQSDAQPSGTQLHYCSSLIYYHKQNTGCHIGKIVKA